MGSGIANDRRNPSGEGPKLTDGNVLDLMSPGQVDAILNTTEGRRMMRDRLLRLCADVFREFYSNKSGDLINPLANAAVEKECRRALDGGWQTEHGTDTVARVVRRMIEEKVSRAVSDRFDVIVRVELREKDVRP